MIHRFKSIHDLAGDLGKKLVKLVQVSSPSGSNFHIAFSGGNTPRKLFEAISSMNTQPSLWEHVNIYWVDERCVPPEHLESNFRMAHEALLQNLSLDQDQVHRIMGEEEPVQEAEKYEKLLLSRIPIRDGLPRFDLILLGMGTDGHTASIFPDQAYLLHSDRVCEVARHPETGQQRITLTGKVINNADQVCFMVTGQDKSRVLAGIFDKESEKFPASLINPNHGILDWYIDEDAASLLNK